MKSISFWFKRNFDGYIFDLDGVLVNSYRCWWNLLNEGLDLQGKPELSQDEMDAGWGQGIDADQRMFFPEWTLDEVAKFYAENFARHAKWIEPLDGAADLLNAIRSAGKKTGVASNSPFSIVNLLLENTGLRTFIDGIACADQVKEGKPAPDLILKVIADLQLSADGVCYIGDSIFDAEAASRAGIAFIGYRRPGDMTVQDLSELAP